MSVVLAVNPAPAAQPILQNTENGKLAFLAKFIKDSSPSPFTRKQEAIFLASKKWTKINRKALNIGLIGCGVLTMFPAFLGLGPVQDWEISDPKNAATMFIVVTIYAGVIGIINYICTGTLPDKAAMAAISATEEFSKAKNSYEELAIHLLEKFDENREGIKKFAEEIPIQNIVQAMQRTIPAELAESICKPLFYAKEAILKNKMSEDAPSTLRFQWKYIELKAKVMAIEASLR